MNSPNIELFLAAVASKTSIRGLAATQRLRMHASLSFCSAAVSRASQSKVALDQRSSWVPLTFHKSTMLL